jgi:hypothetical protein
MLLPTRAFAIAWPDVEAISSKFLISYSSRLTLIKPSFKKLQLESNSDDLRNDLWNILKLFVLDKMEKKRYVF